MVSLSQFVTYLSFSCFPLHPFPMWAGRPCDRLPGRFVRSLILRLSDCFFSFRVWCFGSGFVPFLFFPRPRGFAWRLNLSRRHLTLHCPLRNRGLSSDQPFSPTQCRWNQKFLPCGSKAWHRIFEVGPKFRFLTYPFFFSFSRGFAPLSLLPAARSKVENFCSPGLKLATTEVFLRPSRYQGFLPFSVQLRPPFPFFSPFLSRASVLVAYLD